jgi:hypothetical protein
VIVTDQAKISFAIDNHVELQDNRFAVIAECMYELISYTCEDDSNSVHIVDIRKATECYNISCANHTDYENSDLIESFAYSTQDEATDKFISLIAERAKSHF